MPDKRNPLFAKTAASRTSHRRNGSTKQVSKYHEEPIPSANCQARQEEVHRMHVGKEGSYSIQETVT